MNMQLPQILGNSPLREAIFELRFVPAKSTAGDLLPGILYSALHKDYPEVIALPMATVPRQIRSQNPDLKYQPSHRLSSGPHSIQIGDHSVLLQTTHYPGWGKFKERIESLVAALKQTELVKQIERFSFKYINLIAALESEAQLPLLNIHIDLIGKAPNEKGFLLREELSEGKFTTIIQIAPNTTIKVLADNKEISGLLIDVDTIRQVGNEFWTDYSSLVDEGHIVAKENFYSLLTKPTLLRLEPKG